CEGLSKERPGLAWSSGGGFLAAGCDDGIRLWDVRHLFTPTPPATTASVSPKVRALPSALACVHRAGRYPPLSVLSDLVALVAGRVHTDPALAARASEPGVRALAALRWPAPARPALAVLLLAEVEAEESFVPPPTLPPTQLRRTLTVALTDAEPT